MTPADTTVTNLLGLPRPALEAFVAELGGKPFRARQLMNWVYKRGESSFESMTDLAKDFRAQLAERACVATPQIVTAQQSADGTRKWLLRADASQAFEMVFIPEPDRGTLCISSQVGCALDCSFCSTAQQGFNRNLTTAEIVGQVWLANRELSLTAQADVTLPETRIHEDGGRTRKITNVVLMGMGEPLANFDRVVPALRLFLDDNAYGLSRRRVTLSTSGLVPWIDRLAAECPVALAVSLHAPDDELRNQLVPINRRHPLAELMAACRRYLDHAPRDFVTFEYVMLDGVNDELRQAEALVALVRDVPCKLNLIPFNPFPGTTFGVSPRARIEAFALVLQDAGIVATIRKTRGRDIDAACGQLAGRVQDRTRHRLAARNAPAAAY